jgi:hypothetical protein
MWSNKKASLCKEVSLMRLPMTVSSPQERLVGEGVVVKEIENFGSYRYQKVGGLGQKEGTL